MTMPVGTPTEKWHVKKASPGLDSDGRIARCLGPDFIVEEFDAGLPLAEQVESAHVLLVRSVPVTREVIDAAPRLHLIQRPGDHVEAVDIGYAAARGIPVCNVPAEVAGSGVHVAEHVMFLALALAKRYREGLASLQERRVGQPLTSALRGKVFGLVGIGNTGAPVIGMARAFGMRVRAVKRTVREGMREALGLEWLGTFDLLPELLRNAEFVSIHLPMTKETERMVGVRELAEMKPGAYLINISRGRIVDQGALLEALLRRRLGGAGLDVFWDEPPDPKDPLLALPNVIATPHVAGFTVEGAEELAGLVAENIKRMKSGSPPVYLVAESEEHDACAS